MEEVDETDILLETKQLREDREKLIQIVQQLEDQLRQSMSNEFRSRVEFLFRLIEEKGEIFDRIDKRRAAEVLLQILIPPIRSSEENSQ